MAANNEIGVIQPVAEAAIIGRRVGALVHCDAAQAAGKIPIDVFALDVDYLSISAHKMYGPQGAGALFASSAAPPLTPIMHGGGQEGGIRAGTLPVALIGGFGAAAERAVASMRADAANGYALVELFLQQLKDRQVRYSRLCDAAEHLPGSLALQLHGVDADTLVQMLSDSVSLTTGSACNSNRISPSHVLTSIGKSSRQSDECIRIYFSRYNSKEDAFNAAAHIAAACSKVRLATGEVHQ
jgi:cysteine desulfurase